MTTAADITASTEAAATLPATGSAATPADSAPGGDPIALLRGQIDALDAAIINLVAERMKLSARIQTARINGGGARVALGRERVILDAYRAGLGRQGAHLADAVLQVCRGEYRA